MPVISKKYSQPVYFVDNTSHSITGTTSISTLASFTLPGHEMGVGGMMTTFTIWTLTNSGNNKTFTVSFGGVNIVARVDTTNSTLSRHVSIYNRGSESSNTTHSVSSNTFLGSQSTVATGTTATTGDVSVLYRGTLASAGETITIESAYAMLER